MSTTKKPAATLAQKETEVKATEAKAAVEAEVKTSATDKKTSATDKKTSVKKVATKTTAKKESAAKTTKKAATDAKAPAKATKATKVDVKIAVQFADKNYTAEDLKNIANDVWVYDYGKKASELKDIQLYVKPEESKVYYVFNNEIAGDFLI